MLKSELIFIGQIIYQSHGHWNNNNFCWSKFSQAGSPESSAAEKWNEWRYSCGQGKGEMKGNRTLTREQYIELALKVHHRSTLLWPKRLITILKHPRVLSRRDPEGRLQGNLLGKVPSVDGRCVSIKHARRQPWCTYLTMLPPDTIVSRTKAEFSTTPCPLWLHRAWLLSPFSV